MPEISVVMPVYNCEKYLSSSIDSILSQTFTDFEFIIVCGNGSSGDSINIINEYAGRDSRIKTVFSNHGRPGTAGLRNKGVDIAAGKYIAQMDAYDISGIRRLEIQKLFLDTYPEIGVFGTAHKVLGMKKPFYYTVSDSDIIQAQLLFFARTIIHPSVMVRGELAKNVPYDESLHVMEDYDIYDKFSRITRISNIMDDELFTCRQNIQSVSTANKVDCDEITMTIMGRIFRERLNIELTKNQLALLYPHTVMGYENKSTGNVVKGLSEMCAIFGEIEARNKEWGVYKESALTEVLRLRWNREKHRLDNIFDYKLPKKIYDTWKSCKYYDKWIDIDYMPKAEV